jgi:sirohydrochlorin ferrochelatase
LISASHAKKDIPDIVINMTKMYPALNIKYGRPLGIHPKILKVCSERIETAENNSISSITRAETLLMTVAHGSTYSDTNLTTEKVSQILRKSMEFGGSETSLIGAQQPLLSEALETSIKTGFKRIIIFPYFLFNGVLNKRIAFIVDDIQKKHPGIELLKAQYLNYHELIIDVFMERAREAVFEPQGIN